MMLPDPGMTLYCGAIGLIVIGLAGMVIVKNLFRMLLALALAEAGANMLLVLGGFRVDAIAPILNGSLQQMVDPVPQALVLTSIVIGVGIQALALSMVLQVYHKYGTLNIRELSRQLEADIISESGIKPFSSDEKPAVTVLSELTEKAGSRS
jgi:multicomponent Na+:H+ antiporter subunit C